MGSPVLPGLWCTALLFFPGKDTGVQGTEQCHKTFTATLWAKDRAEPPLAFRTALFHCIPVFPWQINPKGHPGREEARSTLSLLC